MRLICRHSVSGRLVAPSSFLSTTSIPKVSTGRTKHWSRIVLPISSAASRRGCDVVSEPASPQSRTTAPGGASPYDSGGAVIVPESGDLRRFLRLPIKVSTIVESAATSSGRVICQRSLPLRSKVRISSPRRISRRVTAVSGTSIRSGRTRLSRPRRWASVGTPESSSHQRTSRPAKKRPISTNVGRNVFIDDPAEVIGETGDIKAGASGRSSRLLAPGHVNDGSRGDDPEHGHDGGDEDQSGPEHGIGRERQGHVGVGGDANSIGTAAQPARRVHDQVEVGRLETLDDIIGQRAAREQDEPGPGRGG